MDAIKLLRTIEGRILPNLKPQWFSEDRIRHIFNVNNAFRALAQGNFTYIYGRLLPDLKIATDYHSYCISLAGVRREYFALSSNEKKELAVSVALHDIGYIKDSGILHNQGSGELVSSFMMAAGLRGVDRGVVFDLASAHGLYSDLTSQLLISDKDRFSPQRKIQFLILNICDLIGKPAGNVLSGRVLKILNALKNGEYDDPQKYFDLRLRSLLGPAMFSYIEDKVALATLLDTINKRISGEERMGLFRNMTQRFRNGCWPVFQELVMKQGGLKEFLAILLRLSRVAEKEFGGKRCIYLMFEPDFFKLRYEDRPPFLVALKGNPEGDYLETIDNGEDGVIIVNMKKLAGDRVAKSI